MVTPCPSSIDINIYSREDLNMRQRKYVFILFTFLFFILIQLLSCARTEISHTNPNIIYMGRFDFSNPSYARFNWSGSMIKARFEGTSVSILLKDGYSDYDVAIDGEPCPVLVTDQNTASYDIATDLTPGVHDIVIAQRSESHWNHGEFSGFLLDNGSSLQEAQYKPRYKIEFIGDSYTVGYGNESPSRDCNDQQLRSFTNTNKSFGPLIAKNFDAEYTVLGWSGKGMVRNYGDTNSVSADPYPIFYDRILGALDGAWDFSQWTPDLVVIGLGTNDFSTQPEPSDSVYQNAYHNFIRRVSENYPEAYLLCVATHTGPVREYVRAVVDTERQRGRENIHYAEFPADLSMNGCHWHPDTSDNIAIAAALTDTISSFTGWESTGTDFPTTGN